MTDQEKLAEFRKLREEFQREYANFREELKESELAVLGYRNCRVCKRPVTCNPKWNDPSVSEGPRPLCECHRHRV